MKSPLQSIVTLDNLLNFYGLDDQKRIKSKTNGTIVKSFMYKESIELAKHRIILDPRLGLCDSVKDALELIHTILEEMDLDFVTQWVNDVINKQGLRSLISNYKKISATKGPTEDQSTGEVYHSVGEVYHSAGEVSSVSTLVRHERSSMASMSSATTSNQLVCRQALPNQLVHRQGLPYRTFQPSYFANPNQVQLEQLMASAFTNPTVMQQLIGMVTMNPLLLQQMFTTTNPTLLQQFLLASSPINPGLLQQYLFSSVAANPILTQQLQVVGYRQLQQAPIIHQTQPASIEFLTQGINALFQLYQQDKKLQVQQTKMQTENAAALKKALDLVAAQQHPPPPPPDNTAVVAAIREEGKATRQAVYLATAKKAPHPPSVSSHLPSAPSSSPLRPVDLNRASPLASNRTSSPIASPLSSKKNSKEDPWIFEANGDNGVVLDANGDNGVVFEANAANGGNDVVGGANGDNGAVFEANGDNEESSGNEESLLAAAMGLLKVKGDAVATLIGLHSQQENEDGFKARDQVLHENKKATVVGTTKKRVYLLFDHKVTELGGTQPTKKDAVQRSSHNLKLA